MQLTKQWDNENKEIEVGICINWDTWALPFGIQWHKYKKLFVNGSLSFYINILCFRFFIEYWYWEKYV